MGTQPGTRRGDEKVLLEHELLSVGEFERRGTGGGGGKWLTSLHVPDAMGEQGVTVSSPNSPPTRSQHCSELSHGTAQLKALSQDRAAPLASSRAPPA
jgi:hypothetical protein